MNTAQLVSGIVTGALSGSVSGFASGFALLQLHRFRNRLAEKRGQPQAKNLVRTSFHVPGALTGALAGAIASQGPSWRSIAAGFCAFPAVLFVLVLGALIVERARR